MVITHHVQMNVVYYGVIIVHAQMNVVYHGVIIVHVMKVVALTSQVHQAVIILVVQI
jgi:hypothetical protein